MILDVGCQNRPRGHVNMDIDRKSKANILGSVEHIPFRNNSFELVYFHGLLHHLRNPSKAWSEIVRVSSKAIVGDEPHRLNMKAYTDPSHIFKGFSRGHLKKICQFKGDISIRYSLVLPLFPILTINAFKW